MSEEAEYRLAVHALHCCDIHGCKYGDGDCPVERKEVAAMYKCEQCDWEEEQDKLNPRMQALNAEVTALRAALDQERADNEKLRSIAHAADVFVRVEDSTARTMREWHLAFDLLRTALLSGRGEVSGG